MKQITLNKMIARVLRGISGGYSPLHALDLVVRRNRLNRVERADLWHAVVDRRRRRRQITRSEARRLSAEFVR